jgi:ABC transporter
MSAYAILGLSVLMSFVASGVAAGLWVAPRLRTMSRTDALIPLVAPYMFLRTIGLSFLVPGVVSSSLPAAFAVPAAYGDLIDLEVRQGKITAIIGSNGAGKTSTLMAISALAPIRAGDIRMMSVN